MVERIFTFLRAFFVRLFIAPPIPTPPANTNLETKVAHAILHFNNGLAFFKISSTWTDGSSTIHKIDETTAKMIAIAILASAKKWPSLPLTYIMACLAVESNFDPKAENRNTHGSNPANNPQGYDEGIAQLKLRFLSNNQGETVIQKLAFALDFAKAIDYFCSLMAGHIKWAERVLIQQSASSAPDPRLRNKYLLATGAYNFGETGMFEEYFLTGKYPAHCKHVQDIEVVLAKPLGEQVVTSQF